MKKLFLLPLACAVLFIGCGDKTVINPKWDYPNMDIVIEVRDSEGQNWFDSTVEGNLRENDVEIAYEGTVYNLFYLDPNNTRASEPDLPLWSRDGRHPFRMSGYFETEDSNPVQLLFGQFSIDTKEYRGESFTINWGDGTSSVVGFDMYPIEGAAGSQPTVKTAIRVESGAGAGSKSDNSLHLTIVKERI